MTPADIQHLVADVLGVPFPTVAVYARFLREAGLITRGGRGRAAAKMGAGDAAALLAAVCSSQGPGEGPDALRRLDAMRRKSAVGDVFLDGTGGQGPDLGPVTAITTLIDRFRDGEAERAFAEVFKTEPLAAARLMGFTFIVTEPSGLMIRFEKSPDGKQHQQVFRQDGAGSPELQVYRRISAVPLLKIGIALRNDAGSGA